MVPIEIWKLVPVIVTLARLSQVDKNIKQLY